MKTGDRRRLREPDRALVGDDGAHHHHAADHQRVPLPLPLVQELRQPDRTARAADIGDLHPFHGAGRAQNLLDGACGLIPAAAGRGWHEDLEKVDRLRARVAAGQERQRQSGGRNRHSAAQENTSGQHGVPFPGRYSIGALRRLGRYDETDIPQMTPEPT